MEQLQISITIQDAEIILQSLVKQPYEKVADLIARFDTQVRSQIKETTNEPVR